MPGYYGIITTAVNPKEIFCGNRLPIMATGDPLCPSSKLHGPGWGHAFKFKFDVATNHIAATKRYRPDCEPEIVRWTVAEELAQRVARWFAGHEHPPIYVPGSRILRVEDRRHMNCHWMVAHLEKDGITVLDVPQDISQAEPA